MANNRDSNWRDIGEVVAEFISRKPDMIWELAHSLGDHVSRDFNVSCRDSFDYVSVYNLYYIFLTFVISYKIFLMNEYLITRITQPTQEQDSSNLTR